VGTLCPGPMINNNVAAHKERKEEICEGNFHYIIISEIKYKETSYYSIIMRI